MDTAEEYARTKITELYEVINGQEVYAILDINDKDVMEMIQPFAVIMEQYKTVISQSIWNFHVQKYSDLLSLPEVATQIWGPVFTEIHELIDKFYEMSVSIKEIESYLKDVMSENLEEEIHRLVEGCNLCLPKAVATSWIPKFVKSVNYYRDACKAQSAAHLVLAARDALMLEGNFEELEKFKSKVFVFSYIIRTIVVNGSQ